MHVSGLAFLLVAATWAAPAFAGGNLVQNGDFTDLTDGVGQITDGYNITTAVNWYTNGYNKVMNNANVAVRTQHEGPPGDPDQYAANFLLWAQANGGANTWDGYAPNGAAENFLALNSTYNFDRVYQTIGNLAVGEAYTLSFLYAFSQQKYFYGPGYDGDTLQTLGAYVFEDATTWDPAAPIWTVGPQDLPSHGFSGWKLAKTSFTATATSEVLSFFAVGTPFVPPYALITDVSLVEGAIPEPSSWVMMLAGFAGLGVAGWRNRRRSSGARAGRVDDPAAFDPRREAGAPSTS